MKPKSATLLDVAREAGVSRATVARVLSAGGYVGEETRLRVEEAVQRHRDPLPDPLAETPLHRHGVDRDVTGYALDDGLDDLADDRSQHCADFRRQR